MKYSVSTTNNFDKEFKNLDKPIQKRIQKWIKKNLQGTEQPRAFGGPLHGNLSDYWKYRIGDYRIIAQIQDKELIILMIEISNRDHVYDKASR